VTATIARVVVGAAMALTTVVLSACSSAAPSAGPSSAVVPSTTTTTGPSSSVPSPSPSTTTPPAVPLDKAFATKVEAVCTDWIRAGMAHPYTADGGLMAATAAQLPAAADFLDAQPVNHEGQAKLGALGVPASGAAAWSVLIADVGAFQTAAGQAVAAARSADASGWPRAFDAYEAAKETVHHDVLVAGLKGNGSCALLFGRSSNH
jgi:hypothetical protein